MHTSPNTLKSNKINITMPGDWITGYIIIL